MRTRTLLALLLLIPLVDAFVLVAIVGSGVLTPLQTVALVVLTGLLGMILVRAEGRNTLVRFQQKAATGSAPTDELLDGGLLIAAGAFLLTPGLVTDLIGFLLALPPTRYPIRAGIKRWVVVPYLDSKTDGFATGNVWTFGFPDGDGDDNPFGADGFDTGSGGSDRAAGDTGSDDPLGANGATTDDEEYVDVDFEVNDDNA
jgi:Protein affecting phage T7 exclusion by the F plasmid